jgi:hypothetical protein
MEAWQGPAIYFHNNAVFSPHDFKNLCRIGQVLGKSRAGSCARGVLVVRGSACLLRDPFWNGTLVGYI